LHYLLKGTQPIIVALVPGLIEKLEPAFEKAIGENRLLIISSFNKNAKRVSDNFL